MATYQYTPMPAVEGPQVMSIADMINTARGGQAYQQAQQINPLEVQAKQLQVQQSRQINPLLVRQQQAETSVSEGTAQPRIGSAVSAASTAATGAESAQIKLNQDKSKIISNGYVGVINNPLLLDATKNPNSVDKNQLVELLKTFGKNQAKAAGVPAEQSDQIMQPYIDIALNDPASLRGYVMQRHIAGLDQSLQTPTYQTTTTTTPDMRTMTTTPGLGTQQVTAGTVGGVQSNTTPAAGAQIATGMRVPYPVRTANQPYIPERTELADETAGAAYRDGLVNYQTKLAPSRRNVEEAIAQAEKIGNDLYFPKGGAAGKLEQNIRMLINTDDYKMLAKDLANLQITQAAALGQAGNTVAGLDLTKVATGDIRVPPDVLVKIARRAQADMTNIDMQASGAQQFKQKFGDNNMKAFQQAWNANADTKIFEAMNLSKIITDPTKLKEEFDKLFPLEAQRKEFLKKYQNLKQLTETGTQ